tara:strand:+ start:40 stop:486 length:447 start_codon:yes stop_codon:yes gene_type:complete
MKKILKIIILSLLLANVAHAETKEEKRAKYVLLNMQQDYIACYSFYKIGSEYVKKSNGDKSTIDGIEKSSDLSLKLAHDTGELMGMTIKEMSLKVESEMNKQLNLIDNNFSNASILLEKYAQNCKNLIENKKKRISFWEKQAKEKINE